MKLHVYLHCGEEEPVYSASIHMSAKEMAHVAGIANTIWKPDAVMAYGASDIIQPLKFGLEFLLAYPALFAEFASDDDTGTYYKLITFIEKYLDACKKFPTAVITVEEKDG
jgi:hypothetical protein